MILFVWCTWRGRLLVLRGLVGLFRVVGLRGSLGVFGLFRMVASFVRVFSCG